MTIDTSIFIVTLLAIIVLFAAWLVYMEIRLGRFLRGKNGKTLEDSLITLLNQIKEVEDFRKEMGVYLLGVEKRLRRSVQGVETVRFNPFKDIGTGSNQSFSTAFLDEEGNGVVVSSLYSRDRVSVYSKPLKKHSSEYDLTDEEKEAVAKAKPGKV
ncbi:MAG: DUF4446 family protein [Patescibacteria group bacterium]